MLNIPQVIADELSLKLQNVHSALELLTEGATIPFIARYRKEKTGSLNEIELRDINDRFIYLQELETRKQVILDSIASQNLLSDSLKAQITACLQKNDLEDLYLPYKPKRRTRATMAKEKGLTPLAEFIKSLNHPQQKSLSVEKEAEKYLCEAVNSIEEALNGAKDILAEEIAEKAQLRAYLREFISENGAFISHIKNDI